MSDSNSRTRVRLRDARAHSASSQRWLTRQLNDPFVQRAKALGYRARSVFKLEEIDRRFGLIRPGTVVADLGAAPGSWSQYAANKQARVVAVDLQPIAPIAGVTIIEGDFLSEATEAALAAAVGSGVDLVLSDMAASSTGRRLVDRLRAEQLGEAVLEFCAAHLNEGGSVLIKLVRGAEATLQQRAKTMFRSVRILRPDATRSDSSECFLLGLDRRPPAAAEEATDE
ncbi:RlmE family RNA methyltransferase [Geminicoccus flavidas]|uniref:RlmE family RNA methyltransferase n=1 Tax=Geminicoccus flavidas TaxID=2506407 RepID=UPI00135B6194|nr:RlmE family RNA methyltransferase [Geminicoccus flavidas]